MGHTVQIILQDDLPGGKGYVGEVVTVKAGYARNYLIPMRKAYYATPENLERFGVSATMMKKAESIEVEEVSEDKKAADLLRKYLNQKTLTIKRNADRVSGKIHPGKVTAANVKEKLAKHLKIVLEDHEKVILYPEKINLTEIGYNLEQFVSGHQGCELESIPSCTTEVRELGDYCAKIYLRGGFVIPLHVHVVKR